MEGKIDSLKGPVAARTTRCDRQTGRGRTAGGRGRQYPVLRLRGVGNAGTVKYACHPTAVQDYRLHLPYAINLNFDLAQTHDTILSNLAHSCDYCFFRILLFLFRRLSGSESFRRRTRLRKTLGLLLVA